MKYWRYRAFDSRLKVVDGITVCSTFPMLALTLRQQGLQVIDATSISKAQYQAEKRIERLNNTMHNGPHHAPPKPVSKIRRLLANIFKYIAFPLES